MQIEVLNRNESGMYELSNGEYVPSISRIFHGSNNFGSLARERGTFIHDILESLLTKNADTEKIISELDEDIKKSVYTFFQKIQKLNLKDFEIETKVWGEIDGFKYAGRIDLNGIQQNNRKLVVDYKTQKRITDDLPPKYNLHKVWGYARARYPNDIVDLRVIYEDGYEQVGVYDPNELNTPFKSKLFKFYDVKEEIPHNVMDKINKLYEVNNTLHAVTPVKTISVKPDKIEYGLNRMYREQAIKEYPHLFDFTERDSLVVSLKKNTEVKFDGKKSVLKEEGQSLRMELLELTEGIPSFEFENELIKISRTESKGTYKLKKGAKEILLQERPEWIFIKGALNEKDD